METVTFSAVCSNRLALDPRRTVENGKIQYGTKTVEPPKNVVVLRLNDTKIIIFVRRGSAR